MQGFAARKEKWKIEKSHGISEFLLYKIGLNVIAVNQNIFKRKLFNLSVFHCLFGLILVLILEKKFLKIIIHFYHMICKKWKIFSTLFLVSHSDQTGNRTKKLSTCVELKVIELHSLILNRTICLAKWFNWFRFRDNDWAIFLGEKKIINNLKWFRIQILSSISSVVVIIEPRAIRFYNHE